MSFSIRKVGNLYQLRHDTLGTVYQSHNIEEAREAERMLVYDGAVKQRDK